MEDDGHTPSEERDDRQKPWGTSPFRNIGALVGVIASLSVIASFIYDWGFFWALGISFSQAPTTITDHVQSWIIWLPRVIVIGILLLAYDLFFARVERGLAEEEIISTSRNTRIKNIITKPLNIFMSIISSNIFIIESCILYIILWLLFGGILFFAALLGLTILWVLFIKWVFSKKKKGIRYSAFMESFSLYAPTAVFILILMGAMSTGVIRTGVIREEPSMSHRLVIDGRAGVREIVETELLRAFEKWLLIRDENKQLSWIRLDEVKRIEPLKGPNPFKGLACAISSRWCLPRPSFD